MYILNFKSHFLIFLSNSSHKLKTYVFSLIGHIKNMAFNWEATDTNWFVDQEHKMMMSRNPGWNPDGDNGAGDAIGRTFRAYVTYGGDDRFLEGIENCWEK